MTRSMLAQRALRAVAAATLSLSAAVLSAQAAPAAPPTPATPPASAAAAPAAPATPAAPAYLATYEEAMRIGRATVQAAYTGQVDSLVATADPAAVAGDVRARLTDGVAQISLQLGAERRMIAERVMKVEGSIEYWRTAEYEMVPVPLVFRVIMGAKGTWRGFTASTDDTAPAGEEVKP